jgi:hypothetical protein
LWALLLTTLVLLACLPAVSAARKQHAITFGKWITAKSTAGVQEEYLLTLRIRPLYIDDKMREYTIGETHEITDRLFVVRRAFRLNDQLPGDTDKRTPRWRWERGGWLMVDRLTGRVSVINLPLFDPLQSAAIWFRDYAAYCGLSEDGERLYALVAQLGRKKLVLKQELGPAAGNDLPESACKSAVWQRAPVRVSFQAASGVPITFTVRGHVADLVSEEEGE